MHVAAVLRSVDMTDADRAALATLESDLAVVSRTVVRSADANEILQAVASAFGAEFDVMYIDPARVAAAGHLAAVLISQHRRAAQSGRDGLRGAPKFARSAHGTVRLR